MSRKRHKGEVCTWRKLINLSDWLVNWFIQAESHCFIPETTHFTDKQVNTIIFFSEFLCWRELFSIKRQNSFKKTGQTSVWIQPRAANVLKCATMTPACSRFSKTPTLEPQRVRSVDSLDQTNPSRLRGRSDRWSKGWMGLAARPLHAGRKTRPLHKERERESEKEERKKDRKWGLRVTQRDRAVLKKCNICHLLSFRRETHMDWTVLGKRQREGTPRLNDQDTK